MIHVARKGYKTRENVSVKKSLGANFFPVYLADHLEKKEKKERINAQSQDSRCQLVFTCALFSLRGEIESLRRV